MFHVEMAPSGAAPAAAAAAPPAVAPGPLQQQPAPSAAMRPAAPQPVPAGLVVPDVPETSAPTGRGGTARKPQAEKPQAEEQTCRLQLACLPLEWTAQDIQGLCEPYGAVDSVLPDGPGGFCVTFASPETAASASTALSGLQLQTESGSFNTLHCELMQGDGGRLTPTEGEGDAEEEEVPQDDPMQGALCEGGAPLVFYVDDLQLATGDPGPEDHEIFLRDLPLEDYTEQQLREWLDDFGSVTEVIFIRDGETKELTGRGYVRFATHDEAAGLIAAFPQVAEDDGNVKGSWSLSERMLQGAGGPFKADVVSMMAERIRPLQEDLRCAALLFAGDTVEGGAELQAMGLEAGPLHIVCSRHHRLGTPEALQAYLAEALGSELANPGGAAAKASAGGKASRQPAGKNNSNQDVAMADSPAAAPAKVVAPPKDDLSPCILVKGFPDGWQEHQVRLVFAVFGGVAAVRFVEDARGRAAKVQLKIADNMQKAVDQMDGTQVGDGELIEECTISCRLIGMASSASAGTRSVFVDELDMPSRPDVQPSEKDREVFLQSLPVRDCTEEQIRAWLSGFGQVEDVFLLQDQAGTPTGKGYVRFVNHAEAAACVEAQASVADAEEGDVVAHWSESERAMQHLGSVYGADVHTAFGSRTLEGIKKAAKIRSLWMYSEETTPKDPAAPAQEAKQLHFVAECTEEQFADVRSRLGRVLAEFHKPLSGRPADGEKEDPSSRKRTAALSRSRERPANKADKVSRVGEKPSSRSDKERGSKADWGPPPGPHWRGPEGPPPWQHGGYGHPEPWQAFGPWRGAMPPGGPYGPGFPPGKGEWPLPGKGDWKGGPPHGPGWGYPPSWSGPAGFPPDRPPGSFDLRPPYADGHEGGATRAAAEDGKRSGGEARDDSTKAKIDRGEALVKEAKQLTEKGGTTKKAYERYCRGLQVLLDVMPKLREDDPSASELRLRVDGYLEEAERLKGRLEAESKPEPRPAANERGTGGRGDRERERERDRPRDGERGLPHPPERSPRDSPGGAAAGLGGSARPRPDEGIAKGGASKARGSAPAQHDPKGLTGRLERGEALIHEGRAAEDKGQMEEAYEKYCRGLQYVLEVMPQLPNDDPQVPSLRQMVSSYLERAERLKDKLEGSGRGSGRRGAGQEASKHGGSAGERHGGSGRSRSRHRHKHRSRSRSRRHGGHGHGHRRSRSRSRVGGGSRKELNPLPSPHGSHGRGGLPMAPQPPPVRSGPPKAPSIPDNPGAEASRAKGGPPRPPGAAPLLRPKTGTALLVGKAKASSKR
uniref:RRM domain-containing protein n=1 Tax=Alexandrium monilatum TaxID=311494 RepID=A0A7S4QT51_9DINO